VASLKANMMVFGTIEKIFNFFDVLMGKKWQILWNIFARKVKKNH
jgi:hypothetical protein